MEVDVAMPRQPEITLGLVRRKIVEDHMDLPVRIVGHNRVHEIEELDAAASLARSSA
jgi:hypothetical protein